MDTTNTPFADNALSCAELQSRLQGTRPPRVIDVRKRDAFLAASQLLPGALRRDPTTIADWSKQIPKGCAVVVYCVHGHEVSQQAAATLHSAGIDAGFLQGGINAWQAQALPLAAKAAGSSTRWVTRERPKIDRIACPWLVRRFVDADASFVYVTPGLVASTAEREVATPFDVGPHLAETLFTHDGEQCSFDAFIRHYRLGGDPALSRLAEIVRAADTDRLAQTPQAAGLLALSLGMSRLMTDDHDMLEAMMPMYDALYAWCQEAVTGRDEQHNWKPEWPAA